MKSGDIRDLKGTVERENAVIGVFMTLELPTQAMLKEALAAGYYESEFWNKQYRKLQILSIRDLLGEDGVDMPPRHGTHRRAERHKSTDGKSPAGLDLVTHIHTERHETVWSLTPSFLGPAFL